MKKIIVCLAIALMFSVGCLAADFDGYIVRVKENTIDNLNTSGMSLFSDSALFSEIDDNDAVGIIAQSVDSVSEINSEHMLLKADNAESLKELIDLGIVESYEEDHYLELFGYDYSLNPSYSSMWYLDYINAEFAWDAGIYGKGVVVGVIDSGVNPLDDLKKNLLPGKNYEKNKDETDTTDTVSHGTSVAGIIAAACNDIATVGISFNSSIVPLRVTYLNSAGDTVVSTSGAINAIYDAVDYYGCDVLNMSFGSDVANTELEKAVDYAVNKGLIVVAATGNYGNKTFNGGGVINPPMYPAYFENCIGVGNAERFGSTLRIKASSGYNDRVTIAAPGTAIKVVNKTETVDGTSFSSPMVAAAAALAKSIDPSIGQAEFKELITSTANSSYIASSGQSTEKWGAGLLDIRQMLIKLLSANKYHGSEINTVNGDSYAVITNLKTDSDLSNYSVSLTEYDEYGDLKNFKIIDTSLSKYESTEISLNEHGFSKNAIIRIYEDYAPGDLNKDGKINILDASTLLRHLANYNTGVTESYLDVDGNGKVNIFDASAILRYHAGYLVKLN